MHNNFRLNTAQFYFAVNKWVFETFSKYCRVLLLRIGLTIILSLNSNIRLKYLKVPHCGSGGVPVKGDYRSPAFIGQLGENCS